MLFWNLVGCHSKKLCCTQLSVENSCNLHQFSVVYNPFLAIKGPKKVFGNKPQRVANILMAPVRNHKDTFWKKQPQFQGPKMMTCFFGHFSNIFLNICTVFLKFHLNFCLIFSKCSQISVNFSLVINPTGHVIFDFYNCKYSKKGHKQISI